MNAFRATLILLACWVAARNLRRARAEDSAPPDRPAKG